MVYWPRFASFAYSSVRNVGALVYLRDETFTTSVTAFSEESRGLFFHNLHVEMACFLQCAAPTAK